MNDSELQSILSNNPGDSRFVDYARTLHGSGKHLEAIMVCLAGLSANSGADRGKLLLAQIYFDFGFIPFAMRELRELRAKHPKLDSLRRLLLRFDPSADEQQQITTVSVEETVAETEFDLSELEKAVNDPKPSKPK